MQNQTVTHPHRTPALTSVVQAISRLAPGESVLVDTHHLQDIDMEGPTHGLFGRRGTPVDIIMGRIIGSQYNVLPAGQFDGVLFTRLMQDLDEPYVTHPAPGRRHLYERSGLFWVLKDTV